MPGTPGRRTLVTRPAPPAQCCRPGSETLTTVPDHVSITDRKPISDRFAELSDEGSPMTAVGVPVDRRARRREAKRAQIIAAAWELAHDEGLAGISLRDLADKVDLRQPSLYAYFDSKHALYDAMFAEGNRQLIELVEGQSSASDPRTAVAEIDAVVRAVLDRRPRAPRAAVPAPDPGLRTFGGVVPAGGGLLRDVGRTSRSRRSDRPGRARRVHRARVGPQPTSRWPTTPAGTVGSARSRGPSTCSSPTSTSVGARRSDQRKGSGDEHGHCT